MKFFSKSEQLTISKHNKTSPYESCPNICFKNKSKVKTSFVNKIKSNTFLWRKRAHAGSSERPIGHRVYCSLLQQAHCPKITNRNDKKKSYKNALNLHEKYVVFFY